MRFYGDGGTIHGSTEFDVETRDGKVVAVWFRCAALPFKQTEVDAGRAREMERMYAGGPMPRVHGLQLDDRERDLVLASEVGVYRDEAEVIVPVPHARGAKLEDAESIIGERHPRQLIFTGTTARGISSPIADDGERVYALCPECGWTYGGTEVESWRAGTRCRNTDVPNCGGMLVFATVSSTVDPLPDFEAAHV